MRRNTKRSMTPFAAGLVALVLVLIGTYFAFTRASAFDNPFELYADVRNANNLKPRSDVRIAGVNVGKVTGLETRENGLVRVKMEIQKAGLPIHRDAELQIRPKVFLEGNFFVDLRPGSPSAPTLDDGDVLPPTQATAPVQFDQVLAALQSDTREDLKKFLFEYSSALDDGGAAAFNRSIKYWEGAYRNAAIANQAALGQRPGDLHRVLRGQAEVARALTEDEESLKDLITNFNTTALAFAREDDALRAAIPALDDTLRAAQPALASVNEMLPSLRNFSRDALPGTRSSLPTIRASYPFIAQARKLVSEEELRGLVSDLRPTIPALARLQQGSVGFFSENRALSSCQNRVLLPFAKTPIPDPDFPESSGQPFYKEAPRGLVGLSSESRNHDANSPMVRAQFGSGPYGIVLPGGDGEGDFFAFADFPVLGARPARPDKRPSFRPDVPCETQEPPDLNAPAGAAEQTFSPNPRPTAADRKRTAEAKKAYAKLVQHLKDKAAGKPTIDPLAFNDVGLRREAKRLGLKALPDGSYVRIKKERDR